MYFLFGLPDNKFLRVAVSFNIEVKMESVSLYPNYTLRALCGPVQPFL